MEKSSKRNGLNRPQPNHLAAPRSVLARLLVRYAPAEEMHRHLLAWQLDERLAAVVQGAREAAIGAIRMAWWREAIVADDRTKGRGEPLIEAMRQLPLTAGDRGAIDAMIDGWSLLLGDEPMDAKALQGFAQGRGGGLFMLLAGDAGAGQTRALAHGGALWALWDLAGHVSDAPLAQDAILLARALDDEPVPLPAGRAVKPQRLAVRVALGDIARARVPAGGFAVRHYRTIVLRGLCG